MKWNKTKEFKALQKAAYQELKETGFHDIEGGMEGHLLQQNNPTLQLGAAAAEMQGRLSRAKSSMAAHKGGPKSHEHWYAQDVVDTYDRGKSSYYSAAQELATLLFCTNASREMKFACSMHSDGYGEIVIAEELETTRSFVRTQLIPFKDKLFKYLDKPNDP